MVKQAETITKIKFFINNYNWKEIICQPEKDDWKKIEKINAKIAPNGFYAKYIYIYIYSDVMKTIQCTHPPHHHNGFVAT